ncbi:MAG TPA: amidohydrolase family protein [Candidatus Acidoferrum sp.]|nr:amidohydrolase family protein [Candidatus Acidoferrum sp.]
MHRTSFLAALFLVSLPVAAQQPPSFITESSPVIAIQHVQLFDGTGAAPLSDQTVVFDHGKITAVGPASSVTPPSGAKLIDASGKTLIPGIVGMHEHLFYLSLFAGDQPVAFEQPYAFPLLYLASGVTTARTTGSMDPYADLHIKAAVDAGQLPGPNLFLTTPYLQGSPTLFFQMHELKDAAEARSFIDYWHSVGFTSVKAYANIHADELRAGIDEAHKLGMKVTGHLCSVGYRDAAEMGIDNLEHGPFQAPDGELYSKYKLGGGDCDYLAIVGELAQKISPDGPELAETTRVLLAHHVAITSTLAVEENGTRPPMAPSGYMSRVQALLTPASWSHAMTFRAIASGFDQLEETGLHKEMKFEVNFVKAGGLLMAGCDPTGDGHTLAGLGDQRNYELLVEAGFSPSEAIHIMTLNGASFLGISDRVGSIATGKQADLVLLNGDLAKDPAVIEHPITVFKNGVGYDSQAIYSSLAHQVGAQ